MKILIIRNYPNYMNITNATYNIQELGLASALVRAGNICDIVFWTNNEEKKITYNVPNTNRKLTIYYRRARNILKNAIYDIDDLIDKYDIIQTCEYNQLQSIIYAKKYPNKLVVYHGQYYGKENKKYNIWCKLIDKIAIPVYKKMNTKFITKSKLSKDFLVQKGIMEKNVYALGVGINKEALIVQNDEENFKIAKIANDLDGRFNVLYVGEYMPRRHIDFIGDVIKRVNEKGYEVRLVTIGKTNNKYADKVKKYFDKNGISNYIYHIEKIEQKYLSKIYKKCSFFIFPSTYEIFGMVLLEAMYFELPVLTVYNGGSSMLINNNTNGIILDSLDREKWSNKIIELINNKNTMEKIGENAKNTITKEFTWDALVPNFVDVYKSLKRERK